MKLPSVVGDNVQSKAISKLKATKNEQNSDSLITVM